MDELDAHVWVLEPSASDKSRAHRMRRIGLGGCSPSAQGSCWRDPAECPHFLFPQATLRHCRWRCSLAIPARLAPASSWVPTRLSCPCANTLQSPSHNGKAMGSALAGLLHCLTHISLQCPQGFSTTRMAQPCNRVGQGLAHTTISTKVPY